MIHGTPLGTGSGQLVQVIELLQPKVSNRAAKLQPRLPSSASLPPSQTCSPSKHGANPPAPEPNPSLHTASWVCFSRCRWIWTMTSNEWKYQQLLRKFTEVNKMGHKAEVKHELNFLQHQCRSKNFLNQFIPGELRRARAAY